MRTATRAFLAVGVLFWLLPMPAPVAGAGDQGDLPHVGDGGHVNHGDSLADRHRGHRKGNQDQTDGNKDQGKGKQAKGTSPGSGPGDECLVEIHDESGALPDGGMLCQTAVNHVCDFNLALCLNQPEEGCTPANFTKRTFRAMGHCGPVGLLRVDSAGTSSVCGAFTGVRVHTRSSGKAPGQCTIRAAVRSAKVEARTDVDKVTLVCMPPGVPCSITTTTTAPPVTSTTVPATTTSTVQVTTTTAASTTTSTQAATSTTVVPTSTTSTTGAVATTTTTTTTSAPTTTTAMSPSGAFLDALDW